MINFVRQPNKNRTYVRVKSVIFIFLEELVYLTSISLQSNAHQKPNTYVYLRKIRFLPKLAKFQIQKFKLGTQKALFPQVDGLPKN